MKKIKSQIQNSLKAEHGFAAIVAVLTVMGIGLVFSSAFLFSSLRGSDALKEDIRSAQSYYASESGVEDAMYRIKYGKNIGASNNLSVEGAQVTTSVVTTGNTKTIASTADKNNAVRKVQSVLEYSATEVDFFYGVQVGAGGLEMGQNSEVIGNIYSNGPISGESGSKISGDATVSVGATSTPIVSWETQNADFNAGVTTGSSIAVVDATGTVGEYTSLALGSDGFARISYMDDTNKDLKFTQCIDTNCSSSVKTAVDTAGEVFEVTSLALDSNSFAYISYYHDGNDDQKFTRCTNADCTAKNTTIVESSGNVGDTSAVKIGSDGFARIAYLQDDNNDVKFARCTNADCTTKNITTVDSSGDAGEWLSLALGSNGFGRISYYDDADNELNFARCTNDDCTNKNITVIDSTDDVGKHNSLVLDSNNFAYISYFDDTSNDLKFVRCANEDCTNKNITTVDSSGTVGEYTSITLGSDGFARISYYDSSNSALKFVRCTDADCATKNISTVDNSASVGTYTSMALGSDGFARISYYDATGRDLKFIRCADADCSLPVSQVDLAQSFELPDDASIVKAEMYLKKVGSPANATVYIVSDSSGSPGDAGDILATGTLNASLVTGSYDWTTVTFSSPPSLNDNTTYWLVLNTSLDNSNYFIWGGDSADGYSNGTGKKSADWTSGGWSSVGGDLDFKLYSSTVQSIDGVIVTGTAKANTITNSKICGDAYYQTIDASSLNFLNAPTNPTCADPLTNGAAYPGSPDAPQSSMPISQANINQWKTEAQTGGTITGDYDISTDISFGPKEITGNLNMTSNNKTLIVTGTIYVHGNIDISNGSTIRCDSAYGADSCIILADGWVHLSNNGIFSGSGTTGSFLMMLTTLACTGVPGAGCGHHDGAIDVHNNALGVIFYASNGMINLHNGVNITEAVAHKLRIDNTAIITYNQGLADSSFSSGPSAGWRISDWKEIQ